MRRGTLRQWAERVRRWRSSGQTAREFAARERLRASTLLWWSSKLRREGRGTATFIEVAPRPPPNGPGRIEIVVREQVRIHVSGAFDPVVLRQVLAALEAV